MKSLLFIGMILLISGCSQPNMTTIYPDDKQMILKDRTVDLPMPFYDLSMKSQDYPRCHKKGFCSLFPEFRENDFTNSKLWGMMTDENGYSIYTTQRLPANQHGIVEYVNYSIRFSSSISPYTEADRALERGDEKFLQKYYKSYVGKITLNKEEEQKLLSIKHYGKENYPCEIREFFRPVGNGWKTETYSKNISCYKFNPERTIKKTVSMRLIYTRVPTLPKELEPLANEYTYEDLQKRSQRILDSLYIKDGWEK